MLKTLTLLILISLSFISLGQKAIQQTAIKNLPNISIYNSNGSIFNLQDLSRNKIAVIEFWFLTCPPCFIQMNHFNKLYTKHNSNPNIIFLTITRTDSSSLRSLLNNRHDENDVLRHYQDLSGLASYELPTYFIKGCDEKIPYFRIKDKGPYEATMIKPTDRTQCPDVIFDFTHYPALMVFDQKGNLIYNRTGYFGRRAAKEFKEMEKVILSNL